MAVIDITGIYLFMPVFSFLFVFLIIYAILVRFKILGDSQFVNLLISFIISIFFMRFSGVVLYVRTLIPWFVVLLVCIFLILLIGGFASCKLENIQTKNSSNCSRNIDYNTYDSKEGHDNCKFLHCIIELHIRTHFRFSS